MTNKQQYSAPEVEIVHLSMGGAILDASITGTGADVTFGDESSFDSFFGS